MTPDSKSNVDGMGGAAARLAAVVARMNEAADKGKRDAGDVHLIAVSKTFSADAIAPVLEAGHRLFGENRVQEAQAKWPELKLRFPDARVHLIGPLQSNKARDAVALFDAIHTIDRPKIARAVAKEMADQGRRLSLFVQVNTGEEAQKAGVMPRETADFVDLCRNDIGLEIAGLMCIPPVGDVAAAHFAFLTKLAGELGVPSISMGMSADFETAIQLGATHVRVGSAIFGGR